MDFFASLPPREIAGHIVGFFGMLSGLLIYTGKTRSKIIICKFVSDALWAVNYLLLGAYTGAALNTLGMARETVFYNRETKKWAKHIAWLYVFLILTSLSPVFELISLDRFSIFPLLPAIGSIFGVISFYVHRPRTMRILGIFSQAFWITYNISKVNVSAVICGFFTVISIAIGMTREIIADKKQSVTETATDTQK